MYCPMCGIQIPLRCGDLPPQRSDPEKPARLICGPYWEDCCGCMARLLIGYNFEDATGVLDLYVITGMSTTKRSAPR
jgi:hypothetical protein